MTLAVCVPISGCQTSLFGWSSPEMVARVATPDGAPVAGAIVVANWNIEGPWNGASLGQLAIAEAVTDQNGTFRIPAWGPRSPAKGHIRIDEPTVRIFRGNLGLGANSNGKTQGFTLVFYGSNGLWRIPIESPMGITLRSSQWNSTQLKRISVSSVPGAPSKIGQDVAPGLVTLPQRTQGHQSC
jgi:hypothetical protein